MTFHNLTQRPRPKLGDQAFVDSTEQCLLNAVANNGAGLRGPEIDQVQVSFGRLKTDLSACLSASPQDKTRAKRVLEIISELRVALDTKTPADVVKIMQSADSLGQSFLQHLDNLTARLNEPEEFAVLQGIAHHLSGRSLYRSATPGAGGADLCSRILFMKNAARWSEEARRVVEPARGNLTTGLNGSPILTSSGIEKLIDIDLKKQFALVGSNYVVNADQYEDLATARRQPALMQPDEATAALSSLTGRQHVKLLAPSPTSPDFSRFEAALRDGHRLHKQIAYLDIDGRGSPSPVLLLGQLNEQFVFRNPDRKLQSDVDTSNGNLIRNSHPDRALLDEDAYLESMSRDLLPSSVTEVVLDKKSEYKTSIPDIQTEIRLALGRRPALTAFNTLTTQTLSLTDSQGLKIADHLDRLRCAFGEEVTKLAPIIEGFVARVNAVGAPLNPLDHTSDALTVISAIKSESVAEWARIATDLLIRGESQLGSAVTLVAPQRWDEGLSRGINRVDACFQSAILQLSCEEGFEYSMRHDAYVKYMGSTAIPHPSLLPSCSGDAALLIANALGANNDIFATKSELAHNNLASKLLMTVSRGAGLTPPRTLLAELSWDTGGGSTAIHPVVVTEYDDAFKTVTFINIESGPPNLSLNPRTVVDAAQGLQRMDLRQFCKQLHRMEGDKAIIDHNKVPVQPWVTTGRVLVGAALLSVGGAGIWGYSQRELISSELSKATGTVRSWFGPKAQMLDTATATLSTLAKNNLTKFSPLAQSTEIGESAGDTPTALRKSGFSETATGYSSLYSPNTKIESLEDVRILLSDCQQMILTGDYRIHIPQVHLGAPQEVLNTLILHKRAVESIDPHNFTRKDQQHQLSSILEVLRRTAEHWRVYPAEIPSEISKTPKIPMSGPPDAVPLLGEPKSQGSGMSSVIPPEGESTAAAISEKVHLVSFNADEATAPSASPSPSQSKPSKSSSHDALFSASLATANAIFQKQGLSAVPVNLNGFKYKVSTVSAMSSEAAKLGSREPSLVELATAVYNLDDSLTAAAKRLEISKKPIHEMGLEWLQSGKPVEEWQLKEKQLVDQLEADLQRQVEKAMQAFSEEMTAVLSKYPELKDTPARQQKAAEEARKRAAAQAETDKERAKLNELSEKHSAEFKGDFHSQIEGAMQSYLAPLAFALKIKNIPEPSIRASSLREVIETLEDFQRAAAKLPDLQAKEFSQMLQNDIKTWKANPQEGMKRFKDSQDQLTDKNP